jgi:putative hemolysin
LRRPPIVVEISIDRLPRKSGLALVHGTRHIPQSVSLWWEIPGLIAFALASFFFALAESALFALTPWQLHQLRKQSPTREPIVVHLLSQPQDLLATIVLGNTLSNAALIGITLLTLFSLGWSSGIQLAVALGLFFMILVGCEVIPKTLAVRGPDRWSARIAPTMALLLGLTRPLHRLAQIVNHFLLRSMVRHPETPQHLLSDDEYRELLELACQRGTIAEAEKEMISQIIHLDRLTVGDVMKPRSQVACISDDLSMEDMITAVRRHQHRRLPIYDDAPDTIVGILNTRSLLLDPERDLADAIEFPSFVPESMNLLQLLGSFQRQGRAMAVVLDEYGTTAGLVTVEDILERILGPILDEGEAEGFIVQRLDDGRWRVNASMRIDDFRREQPDLGEVPDVDTMGGLLTALLEVVPTPGETANFRGLRLTATHTDDRRVRELLVERVSKGSR